MGVDIPYKEILERDVSYSWRVRMNCHHLSALNNVPTISQIDIPRNRERFVHHNRLRISASAGRIRHVVAPSRFKETSKMI
jgi:hypothetical protein